MDTNLQGIRVVELTHWVAGPLAGQILGEWGADVIHVEDTLAADSSDSPEEMLIIKDIAECIISNDERIFSEYEMEALKGILQGKNRAEIARALGKTEESVENSLQRVRRKAIEYIQGF